MIRRTPLPATRTVDALVIGAGHSGLAMSHCLSRRSIDHVVLERGSVANSWRRERWDSLHLLTPNWQAQLPGFGYDGRNPDGYMDMPELIRFLDRYSGLTEAPIHTDTQVTTVCPENGGYRVITDRGDWWTHCVVIATGAFKRPSITACASAMTDPVQQVTMQQYRNPRQLEDGGVLVVGASATGLQLAEEIHRSGRPVTLAAGEHVRLPRRYRGRDIQWWMKAVGVLDQRYDEVDDLQRARHVPSPQLIGSPEGRTLDLNALTAQGVSLVGRLATVRDGQALFSGSLAHVCELADLKMNRLLETVDEWIGAQGLDGATPAAERFEATRPGTRPRSRIDLASGEFRSIVWATGGHPDYDWLKVPVLDQKGRIRHDGGVADAPGLYVMGLPFLRRRKSTFLHGAEDDANDLADHLHLYLDSLSQASSLLRMAV